MRGLPLRLEATSRLRASRGGVSGFCMHSLGAMGLGALSGRGVRGLLARRRPRCDRRVRQVHRPRPGGRSSAGRSCPCPFTFLLHTLLAKLVQLRNLPVHLLPLSFADPLEPHAALGGHSVERHRDIAFDRDVSLD
jgi:hypothetical protein